MQKKLKTVQNPQVEQVEFEFYGAIEICFDWSIDWLTRQYQHEKSGPGTVNRWCKHTHLLPI